MISEVVPGPEPPAMEFLASKQLMLGKLKDNLAQTQARIKKYADLKRTERVFQVGDMVHLKLQPFRHSTFQLHKNLKLSTKYYGPFKILENFGQAAYKLKLPASAKIHPAFHVSQLKNTLVLKLPLKQICHWSPQMGISSWNLLLYWTPEPYHADMILLLNGSYIAKTSVLNKQHGKTSCLSSQLFLLFILGLSKNGGPTVLLMGKKQLKGEGAVKPYMKTEEELMC
jgi:ribosomal protein L21E